METLEVRLQKRMHVSLYALLFLTVLLGISILLEGCSDTCETKVHYTYFEPVYTSFDEFRSSAKLTEPQLLTTIGKIYLKDNLLFINDPGKGIHIIDNTDPKNPVAKSFLNIPGNFDLAVKGNSLYADSFIDLIVFDISHIDQIREVNRLENVFYNYNNMTGFPIDPERGFITGWNEKESMEVTQSDCTSDNIQPVVYLSEGIAVNDARQFNSAFNKSLALAPGIGSGPGAGGSMARFTINENFLYALDAGFVQPFDITNESSPIARDESYISWDMETIFPYRSNLFVGSSSGMYILDVSNPVTPLLVSTYTHIRSCDPVVVDDHYAYVTLRSGTECQGFTNQLEVIDIDDLQNPQLVSTYMMNNPHGLGIDQKTLFVCDGDAGLKVYDAEDVNSISSNLLAHYDSINAFDVIPFNNVLVMIGQDGLFQYDYSDPHDIKLLSHLPVHAN
jgi:hypothetical protein